MSRSTALAALCAAALLIACAGSPRPAGLEPTSRTLGPYVYFEEGSDALVTVGALAARERADMPFFPLEIGIANKRQDRVFTLSRESFSVSVGDGPEIPAATAQEVIEGYKALEADRQLFRSREFTATKFDRYVRVPSRFYPNSQPRRGVVQEQVELNSGTYLQDILYFRNPGYSLRGQLVRLLIRLRAGEDPIVVAFTIG